MAGASRIWRLPLGGDSLLVQKPEGAEPSLHCDRSAALRQDVDVLDKFCSNRIPKWQRHASVACLRTTEQSHYGVGRAMRPASNSGRRQVRFLEESFGIRGETKMSTSKGA